jgi:uncharacterized damage-inducible protein DinB
METNELAGVWWQMMIYAWPMSQEQRHFAYLARYNRSANAQMLGFLERLSADELAKPRGSYFGSLQGILNHLLTGDINWLRRFRDLFSTCEPLTRPNLLPAGHLWTVYEFAAFEDYRRERAAVDAIFEEWIALADVSRFGEVLAYSDSHGQPRRYVARDALDHVFNHQTHHRGQVSQILDEMGIVHDFSNLIAVAEIPVF